MILRLWLRVQEHPIHVYRQIAGRIFFRRDWASAEPFSDPDYTLNPHTQCLSLHIFSRNFHIYKLLHWNMEAPATCRIPASCMSKMEPCIDFASSLKSDGKEKRMKQPRTCIYMYVFIYPGYYIYIYMQYQFRTFQNDSSNKVMKE